MALEGRLTICLRPPTYSPESFSDHPELSIIEDLMARHKVPVEEAVIEEEESETASESETEDADSPTISVSKNKFSALNIQE